MRRGGEKCDTYRQRLMLIMDILACVTIGSEWKDSPEPRQYGKGFEAKEVIL